MLLKIIWLYASMFLVVKMGKISILNPINGPVISWKIQNKNAKSCNFFHKLHTEIMLFVCPRWKGFFKNILFLFFAHIRTPITKSTCLHFHCGNPGRCIFIRRKWWFQLQFSHIPTYLFLWYIQLVNTQSRTKSWKI